jgi:two-component system KDP operon response regulator KdpE
VTSVLVVEDDPNIVDLIRANLLVRGYAVAVATDRAEALAAVETKKPDVILLDLMLPGVEGFELCYEIRERTSAGLIVVSARRAEQDKVTALNAGADDYLTKPFGIEELMARITATLRRTRRPAEVSESGVISLRPGLVVDLERQLVERDGATVHLTPTEFSLLAELVRADGRLLSHAALLRAVWGRGYETETEYLRVYIRRLRSKLELPGEMPLILTQPRAGYRLVRETA